MLRACSQSIVATRGKNEGKIFCSCCAYDHFTMAAKADSPTITQWTDYKHPKLDDEKIERLYNSVLHLKEKRQSPTRENVDRWMKECLKALMPVPTEKTWRDYIDKYPLWQYWQVERTLVFINEKVVETGSVFTTKMADELMDSAYQHFLKTRDTPQVPSNWHPKQPLETLPTPALERMAAIAQLSNCEVKFSNV